MKIFMFSQWNMAYLTYIFWSTFVRGYKEEKARIAESNENNHSVKV